MILVHETPHLAEPGGEVVRDGGPRGALHGRDAPAEQARQRVVPRGAFRRPRERRRLARVVGGGGVVDDAGAGADGAGRRAGVVEASPGGARWRRRRGGVDGSEGEGEGVVDAALRSRVPVHFPHGDLPAACSGLVRFVAVALSWNE
jgi:hypothetical protein